MMDFLTSLIPETARIFYEGSFYILLGFAIAGLLHEFLPKDLIARHLGREDPRSIATAALLGAPIPLCSCGVLPAAAALRQKGAGRSPTMAFLVSTPETGVDSIALTYGLLGGVMAIVRPVVAVVTALVAGLLSMLLPGKDEGVDDQALRDLPLHTHEHHDDDAARSDLGKGRAGALGRASLSPLGQRLRRALHYGFGTLLDDLAFWLLVGILLTGVLSAALPDDFFRAALGLDRGLLPMLLVILAGVPLYLCASASTPVAAALVAKGLSPGAALVFLLVGPATNAATIAVVGRLLGGRRLRIYLGSIIGVALVAGLLVDTFAADAVRRATLGARGEGDAPALAALKVFAALAFVALLALSAHRTRFREGLRDMRDQAARFREALRTFEPRRLASPLFLGVASFFLVLTFLPNAFLVVEPGHRGIVQQFGRVVASDLEPGLHWHWPPPIGRGTTVDVERVRQVGVGVNVSPGAPPRRATDSYYITADENVIDVRGVVHYRVADAVRFALGLEGSEPLLRSLARRELIRIATSTPIDTLYTTARSATEEAVRRALGERVSALGLGIHVLDVRLLDVHAPANVHDAFRDVASAVEDREREIHEGSAYAAETTTEAQGEASAVREQARADAARARALARGSTAAFVGISAVHERHPQVTETRLYLETLERSLAAPHKYVHGASRDGGELDLWIGTGAMPLPTPGQPPTGRRALQPPFTRMGSP
ncbi:MAG: SO_0444 family Cu/Zn efflux transporter [Myxococcota bacterium]|nr:SO_0444 family Cu/Zn efflux transporter [Myxococcota bacterium]